MSAIKEDYIMRMIEMMGEVIIAALNLKKAGKYDDAEQTLENALTTLLPEHGDLIEMVDEETTISLLGSSELAQAYVELLLERAELKLLRGDILDGESLQTRALKICLSSSGEVPLGNPQGQLIWGRMAGLDLKSLLDENEISRWKQMDDFRKLD